MTHGRVFNTHLLSHQACGAARTLGLRQLSANLPDLVPRLSKLEGNRTGQVRKS